MTSVSIGVPTYNGVEYITQCLKCLQQQTFEDFEVVISDNCSIDGTSDICAEFSQKDKRFKHVRNTQTIPWEQNFSRARDLTQAQYFMWRADDDLAAPDYLECLVKHLDSNQSAGIAVAPILRMIDQKFERLFPLPEIVSNTKIERFSEILLGCHPSWFYGLWRREAVTKDWNTVVRDYPFLWASDHLAILPSIIDNNIEFAPETFFIQRIKRKEQVYKLQPDQLVKARKHYKNIAVDMLLERGWTKQQFNSAESILEKHIELRVARKWRTYKRWLKQKLTSL